MYSMHHELILNNWILRTQIEVHDQQQQKKYIFIHKKKMRTKVHLEWEVGDALWWPLYDFVSTDKFCRVSKIKDLKPVNGS